ncbi:MAG: D-glycerate dehydrogenase [Deltaproteobacteria bacterium]|nr:D-glycerate dehydrogenase [Deltaproteobacteria bacterium]
MARIFVTRRLPGDALERLREAHELEIRDADTPIGREELIAGARRSEVVICALTDRIDAGVLHPGLKVVANYAVGVDNIDLAAAREAGVVVTNTPDVLTDATADLAFALLLAAARRLPEAERFLRAGRWEGFRASALLGRRVAGAHLGVVGAGRIGQAVLSRGKGFGMELSYWSREPKDPARVSGATHRPLDELLERCDFVSLNVALTPETRHLLDARRLERMKPGAVLVNTSRGPVVDEAALARVLAEGPLFAAGLDVYEEEPRVHPALLELENVVLIPHLGSATDVCREAMVELCVDGVEAVLAGREPANRVI